MGKFKCTCNDNEVNNLAEAIDFLYFMRCEFDVDGGLRDVFRSCSDDVIIDSIRKFIQIEDDNSK